MKRIIALIVLLGIPAVAMAVTYTSPKHGTFLAEDIVAKGPWIDVRAYGATGDGATDDTSALNNAETAASGGILYIPDGTYSVTGWNINTADIRVIAEPNASIKAASGIDTQVVNISANGVEWFGGEIDGNRSKQTVGTGNCVVLDADDIKFHNSYIYSCSNYGVFAKDNNNFSFKNNRVENTYRSSFIMQENGSASTNIKITNNVFDRSDESPPALSGGMHLASAQTVAQAWFTDVVISGNNVVFPSGTINTSSNVGIETEYAYGVVISDNTVRRGNIGISATKGRDISIDGNTVDIDNASAREGVELSRVNNAVISDNTVYGNDVLYRGILVSSADTANYPIKNISITGNKITGMVNDANGKCVSLDSEPENITIAGNVCTDTFNGVSLNDGTHITVSANSFYATGGTDEDGVEVAGESSHVSIIGNNFRGSTINLFHDDADTIDNVVITANIFSTNSVAYYRTTVSGGGTIGSDIYVWGNWYNNGSVETKHPPSAQRTFTPQSVEGATAEGMVKYADSTNWNPGAGKGLYVYDGSEWDPLNQSVYSSIYASSHTITVTTAETYYIATASWIQNEENGPSFSTTTGKISVPAAVGGVYEISYTLSFSAGNSETITCGVFIDGTIDESLVSNRELGTAGGDIGDMGGGNLATLSGGEDIDLRCKNSGTTDIAIPHGAFWMSRITQ